MVSSSVISSVEGPVLKQPAEQDHAALGFIFIITPFRIEKLQSLLKRREVETPAPLAIGFRTADSFTSFEFNIRDLWGTSRYIDKVTTLEVRRTRLGKPEESILAIIENICGYVTIALDSFLCRLQQQTIASLLSDYLHNAYTKAHPSLEKRN
jgi:hypothetical protein